MSRISQQTVTNSRARKIANTAVRIVFVTGASRSGTTMLSRILGTNDNILRLNELHYFGDVADPGTLGRNASLKLLEHNAATIFSRQAHGIWGCGPNTVDYERARMLSTRLAPADQTSGSVFCAALEQLACESGKQMVVEHTPRNIFYAEQLLAAYPDAIVLHMMRDPRGVLASQKFRWRRKRLGGANIPVWELIRVWANYHPMTVCRLWEKATRTALMLSGHPRFRILRFEDILAEPENEISALCRFLDLTYDPAMVEVPQVGSSLRANCLKGRGIDRQASTRWRDILSRREVALCEKLTLNLIKQFGYVPLYDGQGAGGILIWQTLRYPFHVLGVLLSNPRRAWIVLKAMRRRHSNA